MGVDVEIWVKAPDTWRYNLGTEFIAQLVRNDEDYRDIEHEATHFLDTLSRYYSEHHDRGHWPTIRRVLMDILNDPLVEKVWYFSDNTWIEDGPEQLTLQRIQELDQHWNRTSRAQKS